MPVRSCRRAAGYRARPPRGSRRVAPPLSLARAPPRSRCFRHRPAPGARRPKADSDRPVRSTRPAVLFRSPCGEDTVHDWTVTVRYPRWDAEERPGESTRPSRSSLRSIRRSRRKRTPGLVSTSGERATRRSAAEIPRTASGMRSASRANKRGERIGGSGHRRDRRQPALPGRVRRPLPAARIPQGDSALHDAHPDPRGRTRPSGVRSIPRVPRARPSSSSPARPGPAGRPGAAARTSLRVRAAGARPGRGVPSGAGRRSPARRTGRVRAG